jgi:hypothetical protein
MRSSLDLYGLSLQKIRPEVCGWSRLASNTALIDALTSLLCLSNIKPTTRWSAISFRRWQTNIWFVLLVAIHSVQRLRPTWSLEEIDLEWLLDKIPHCWNSTRAVWGLGRYTQSGEGVDSFEFMNSECGLIMKLVCRCAKEVVSFIQGCSKLPSYRETHISSCLN